MRFISQQFIFVGFRLAFRRGSNTKGALRVHRNRVPFALSHRRNRFPLPPVRNTCISTAGKMPTARPKRDVTALCFCAKNASSTAVVSNGGTLKLVVPIVTRSSQILKTARLLLRSKAWSKREETIVRRLERIALQPMPTLCRLDQQRVVHANNIMLPIQISPATASFAVAENMYIAHILLFRTSSLMRLPSHAFKVGYAR